MTKKIQFSVLVLFVLIMFAGISAIGQTVNMNRWVELTVSPGTLVKLELSGFTDTTSVKVVSGTYDTTVVVGTYSGFINFNTQSNTMRVYGDLRGFYCSNNEYKISGLNASHNTVLEELNCYYNDIQSLNINGCVALEHLQCNFNEFTSLDLSGCVALRSLDCHYNNITSINISNCVNLANIDCSGNRLTACGLDSLFHQLPRKSVDNRGSIVIRNGSSFDNDGAFTCCDTIATNHNWSVWNWGNPVVNSNYACPYFTIDIEEIKAEEIAVKVYPNPVSNSLNIETDGKVYDIILYDILGKEVLRTKKTNDIDVSNLNNGVYILKLITETAIGEYKIVKE